MIRKIKLQNFKCFDSEITFDTSKINVWAGYNGRGKSTVMQSILLVSQSVCRYDNVETLDVNGTYVSLGVFEDLVNNKTNEKVILFSFDTDECDEFLLGYKESDAYERKGNLCKMIVGADDYFASASLLSDENASLKIDTQNAISIDCPSEIIYLFKNIYFISADRKGPQLFEQKSDINSFNPIGTKGEYMLNYISKHSESKNEINQWLSYIMDDGAISLNGDSKESTVLSLNFCFAGDSNKFKSIDVGYGYSYALSIIVSLIAMQKGILIIENPEAHLHPMAQLRLTEMIAKMVGAKPIQVFIETHSEHIVNGFRIAAIKEKFGIDNTDLSIYFFDKDYSVQHLEVQPNGRIANWPKGFFDQFEYEMAQIIQLGSKIR
jgi:predicted ATPase